MKVIHLIDVHVTVHRDIVKVKKKINTTKYAVLLPQPVSGTNMPIIRSTITKKLPLLGGHTWKAAWIV
jgi:hypothetical protein